MSAEIQTAVDQTIRDALDAATTPPQARQAEPLPRWTLKRLVRWVKETFAIDCSRETLRQVLKDRGFSWKKARKLLNKANPGKRAEFLQQLEGHWDDALHDRCLLVYVDEAHVHLDTDEGYVVGPLKGERFWVSSSSPGLAKVSFYGLYLYNLGQVRIWPDDRANKENTVDMLKRLRAEFPDVPLKLIWDGAPDHRATTSFKTRTVDALDITLAPLPAYSPEFMPVEHLWQWLREDITDHAGYDQKAELIAQVNRFQQRINADPIAIADRLWVKSRLDQMKKNYSFQSRRGLNPYFYLPPNRSINFV